MLPVAASVQLGSLLYETHAAAVVVHRGLLPALDRAVVRLPNGVRFEAEPGDDAVIVLDGGDGRETVLTGAISGVRRRFDGVEVTVHNGGLALARYWPSVCLEQVTVGDVVVQLCGDTSVDTGDVADGPTLTSYVAEGRASAAEEIARLAAHLGARAVFSGDGALGLSNAASDGELALLYGRELVDVDVQRWQTDDSSRTVVGEGAGDPGASNAHWPIADFLKGAAPAPGAGARRRAEPELRTTDDAQLASAAWTMRQQHAERAVRFSAWLLPAIAPGYRVELQQLPDTLDLSAAIVARVVHRIDPSRGASTTVWGTEDTGAAGLTDLLGQLAGAALGAIGL